MWLRNSPNESEETWKSKSKMFVNHKIIMISKRLGAISLIFIWQIYEFHANMHFHIYMRNYKAFMIGSMSWLTLSSISDHYFNSLAPVKAGMFKDALVFLIDLWWRFIWVSLWLKCSVIRSDTFLFLIFTLGSMIS